MLLIYLWLLLIQIYNYFRNISIFSHNNLQQEIYSSHTFHEPPHAFSLIQHAFFSQFQKLSLTQNCIYYFQRITQQRYNQIFVLDSSIPYVILALLLTAMFRNHAESWLLLGQYILSKPKLNRYYCNRSLIPYLFRLP